MRIGFSTSVVQRGKTGVAQYVFALLRALKPFATDHEFVLFTLEEDLPLFGSVQDAMRIVPVPEQHRPAIKNVWWHQTALPRLARRLQLDVLHVPSYRRMLWRQPCALTATIHDLAPFHIRGKYDPARMFYGRVVVPRLAHRQDEIIAVSHNTARDVERFFGIPVQRQKVILNGIDHQRFCPGDKKAALQFVRARWNLDQPFFLYVSRIEHPGKNHARLIAAFEQFKRETPSSWTLAFAGSDWQGATAVHTLAERSPVARDIRFLGFVEDEILPTLYRAAGALVYPSLFEGFGLPPAEAMACQCPVLSSARGALEEVVGDAAMIIDPESTADLQRGLTEFALNPALREQLQRAGVRNAARFNWQTNAQAVVEVWQRARARGVRRGNSVVNPETRE